LCAQQDAVIEAPAVAVPREKEIKPVKKPDEEAFKARMSEQDERIAAKQARLEQIKQIFDSRDGQRGAESSAAALSKAKFQEARAESRRILQERRSIYDQINAAEELKKQQQDLTQRLRSELPFFSVDEIERRIKQLEMSQQTSSLTIKEDRKVMDDIRRLNANKPMIKQYDEAQESLRGVKGTTLPCSPKSRQKNAELASAKEVEEGLRAEMDDARARDDAKKSDLPALHKERDECRREMSEIRLELKHMRDEFSEQRKEWFTYQKQMRDQKQRELLERKAARQAEISAWRKLLEEEEARRDPWEEEKLLCEQLISYVEKYLPIKIVETAVNAAEEAAAKVRAEIQAGGGRKKAHEDDEYLIALRSNKGKKKGGGGGKSSTPPTPKTKVVKMTHAPESFESFGKLGFKPPLDTGECPQLYKALLEKREWLKTAPPKQKNRKFDPSATPSAEARGPAEGKTECHFDLSTFDKEEVEKKKAAEDKKQAERDAIEAENLKRMEAIEKSGKRAAGGLHKFDPDEVDVNGGDATADDLMAAFGFSDMGGEMKGAEVIGDEAAAEAAMEETGSQLLSIKPVSESTVQVNLNLQAKA